MNNKKLLFTIALALLVLLPIKNFSQVDKKPNWNAFKFLIGEWQGKGSGAEGSTSFKFDLDNNIIIRNNKAVTHESPNQPALTHNDLMILYYENDSVKAIYFDNEGHVIHYSVNFSSDSSSVIMTSNKIPSSPRFRFTYKKLSGDNLNVLFEIAFPGKQYAFSNYKQGTIIKIK